MARLGQTTLLLGGATGTLRALEDSATIARAFNETGTFFDIFKVMVRSVWLRRTMGTVRGTNNGRSDGIAPTRFRCPSSRARSLGPLDLSGGGGAGARSGLLRW